MHTRTIAGTVSASLVGIAIAAAIWLLAPVRGTVALVGGALGGPVATLLVAGTLGDRRYLQAAGLSTYLGLGLVTFLLSFPSEGAVEWLFVGFGGLGLVLFLARIRLGNCRRIASTPPESGRTQRLVGRVGSVILRVRQIAGRVAATPLRVSGLGILAGGVFAGVHAFGLVAGYAPLAIAGLVGLFCVAMVPFYLLTEWRALDGHRGRSRVRASGTTSGSTDSVRARAPDIVGIARTFHEVVPSVPDLRTVTSAPADSGRTPTPHADSEASTPTPADPDGPSAAVAREESPAPESGTAAASDEGEAETDADARTTSESIRRPARSRTAGVRSLFSAVKAGARIVARDPGPSDPSEERSGRNPGPIPEVSVDSGASSQTLDLTAGEPTRTTVSITDVDPRIERVGTRSVARCATPGTAGSTGGETSVGADSGRTVGTNAGVSTDDYPRETVSRRVAEVLYGTHEESARGGDPTPDGDDWTDQLESPEV